MQPFDRLNLVDFDPSDCSITQFIPLGTQAYVRKTYSQADWLAYLTSQATFSRSSSAWYELDALPPGRRIFIHLDPLQQLTFNEKEQEIVCHFPKLTLSIDLKQIPVIQAAFRSLHQAFQTHKTPPHTTQNGHSSLKRKSNPTS